MSSNICILNVHFVNEIKNENMKNIYEKVRLII